MKRNLLLILFVLLLLGGCRTQKETVSSPRRMAVQHRQTRVDSLMASYPDWVSFYGKGNATIALPAQNISLSSPVLVTLVKDRELQVSLRPFLGLEMARLRVTTDSVFAVVKASQCYLAESLADVGAAVHTPVTFEMIQSMLLGRVFALGGDVEPERMLQITDRQDEQWKLSPRRKDRVYDYGFELDGFRLAAFFAGLHTGGKSITVGYGRYTDIGGREVPLLIEAAFEGQGRRIEASLDYNASSVRWDRNQPAAFPGYAGYKRVHLGSLLNVLLK